MKERDHRPNIASDRRASDQVRPSHVPLSEFESGEQRTPEEERQFLKETDLLIALVAEHLQQRRDWPDDQDPRFLEWLAREHEADDGDQELWTREEVAEVARRIESRIRAASAPVGLVSGSVRGQPPVVAGTVAAVIDAAAKAWCALSLPLAPAAGSGRVLWDEECEEWIPLPSGVPRGRYLALGVAGDSMMPLLHPGDVILVRLGPVARSGAVVVVQLPDEGYVTKQLGHVSRTSLELRSINAVYPPVRIPRGKGTILGAVVLRWCAHGGRSDRL